MDPVQSRGPVENEPQAPFRYAGMVRTSDCHTSLREPKSMSGCLWMRRPSTSGESVLGSDARAVIAASPFFTAVSCSDVAVVMRSAMPRKERHRDLERSQRFSAFEKSSGVAEIFWSPVRDALVACIAVPTENWSVTRKMRGAHMAS
jgi:hypothetical protein